MNIPNGFSRPKVLLGLATIAICGSTMIASAGDTSATHGYSVSGTFLYPPSFTQFNAASSDRPGSCEINLVTRQTFDSLNPWIIRGRRAPGVFEYLYDSLLQPSVDEFQTSYGLIAESIQAGEDGRSVTFVLHPKAQFHDGHPITATDVVFTADTMRASARPFWRSMLKDTVVEAVSERVVHVTFHGEKDPSNILSFGSLPVLPAHYWSSRNFGEMFTEVPVGSGPYRIASVNMGQSIRFERVENYWAANLPTRKGMHHFKSITYTYISDDATSYLSFLRGDLDQIGIDDMRQWDSYRSHDAITDGTVHVTDVPAWWPMGMNGFFFNMRDARFQDRRVRAALASLVPFDWINQTQLFSAFERTSSYFGNAEHEAASAPTADEKAWMETFPAHFPDEAFSERWQPADASRSTKESLANALRLLADAGWKYDENSGRLVNQRDGTPLNITILTSTTTQDKIFGAWQNLLNRIGVEVTLQRVDASSFQERYQTAEFEMVYRFYIPPLHPGREQVTLWGSPRLQTENVRTILGIDSPAVDGALERLLGATTLPERTHATRLLDRALQWGLFAVPTYQNRKVRTAYWSNRIRPPANMPRVGGGAGFWTCAVPDTAP